jgi:glycosyltransferase involved in cell wall biosynthesis
MKSKEFLLTIITVSYNSSKYLERCIKSVLSQSYSNVEYIIIDGGSSDKTVDLIKKYEDKISFWVSEPDQGIYDAMNKGIKQAKGEIIHFLNSDDYFVDNKVVEDVIHTFSEYLGIELVYGYVIKVIEKLDINFEFKSSVNKQSLVKPYLLPQQAFFYKKEIFEKLGNFDTSFKGSGDYEFLCRMYTSGINMKEINRPIVYFRKGGVSSRVSEGHRVLKKYFGVYYAIRLYIRSRFKHFLRWIVKKLRLQSFVYKILYGKKKI